MKSGHSNSKKKKKIENKMRKNPHSFKLAETWKLKVGKQHESWIWTRDGTSRSNGIILSKHDTEYLLTW